MKTIKEVKIVFENCEEVVIKPEHFAVLDMEHSKQIALPKAMLSNPFTVNIYKM